VQRVRLAEPLRGTIGAVRIFVMDVSLRGLRVAHQENIGEIGSSCVVRCEWKGQPMDLTEPCGARPSRRA